MAIPVPLLIGGAVLVGWWLSKKNPPVAQSGPVAPVNPVAPTAPNRPSPTSTYIPPINYTPIDPSTVSNPSGDSTVGAPVGRAIVDSTNTVLATAQGQVAMWNACKATKQAFVDRGLTPPDCDDGSNG